MTVKIVILNWNGRAHLERFLPSVLAHSPKGSVVVADNGSQDDSLAWLRESHPEVELIVLDENYGYAGGYNRALERIEADYFVLLNSDVEVPPHWLEPLLQSMEDDPAIAALSPKIRSFEQPAYFEYAGAAGGFIDMFGYPFCRGRILGTIEIDRGQYDQPRDVFWASGACMLVRAALFRELGGFDADFFAHMEEIDFCWRAKLAGYKVVADTRSEVFHLGGGTLPNNSPRKLYLNYRNNLSMLYKNLSRIGLCTILLLRGILDTFSAVIFLLQGRVDFFKVVFRAHVDFHRSRRSLRRKRAFVKSLRRVNHPSGIYRGSIILRYALGRHTFSRMM